jgi:tetratricopeptide (TPR) repeat protein
MSVRSLSLCAVALSVATLLSGCSKDPEVAKREFVESGDRFMAEEKYAEAAIQYKNAINQDPRYGEARQKLAEAYVASGDLPSAYGEYVRAADVMAGDPSAQVKAGEMLLLARNYEEAESRANKALALNPKYIEAQVLKANALAGLNRVEDAVAEVEEAIRNDPDRISSYSSLGFIQMIRGDQALAEAAFKKAVDTDPSSVNARLALANFYWSAGRRSEAEEHLKRALTINPKNSVANRMMAMLSIGSGRQAEAEPYLKAMAENDRSEAGKLTLADYYVTAGRRDEARAILNEVAASGNEGFAKATLRLAGLGAMSQDLASTERLVDSVLAKEPHHVDALLAKTLLQANAGKLTEALGTVQAAVTAGPTTAGAHFMLGEIQMRRGEHPEAIKAFTDALKHNPRMARAEIELAKLHLAAGRLTDAEAFAQAALSKISGALEAHLMMARINLAKGDTDAAERKLRPMLKALPNDSRVQTEVGLLEVAKKNWSAARAAFSRALELQPNQFDALKGIVALDVQDRKVDAVRTRLDTALRSAPDNPNVLLLAGRAYSRLGDTATAEKMWRKTAEVDPDNLAAYVELGQLYGATNRLDAAVAGFQELTKANPKSVQGHTILGMLLQSQNKLSEAQAHYETVMSLDPNAAVAANNLALILAEQGGNLDVALQYAQTAKSRLPDRPEIADTLGWIYYKKGLVQQALGPFSESVRLAPKNATYHYHLGLAQLDAGDRSKARASLTQALALSQSFKGADEARQALAKLNQ